MVKDYDQFAKDNKGIFRIGAIDCGDFSKICEKEKVKTFPTVKVFPPHPIPEMDLVMKDNKFDPKDLKKLAGRFIQDKSIEITNNNHQTFTSENIGTPKVLLFTDKKGTPFIFRALSQHFEKTLEFGIVRSSEDSLVKKYKVKSFPSVFVVKSEGKPLQFNEKEFTY